MCVLNVKQELHSEEKAIENSMTHFLFVYFHHRDEERHIETNKQ